ncbi:MAG TPA: NUDIX domain-containing protein [Pseudomonadales bacterium]|nr:NUDIX domain-containing protein [Pseudomonadales bacterium]
MTASAAHPVRTAARAVIIEDGALLVVEYGDPEGPWFLLPGGGQEHEETLDRCLQREVREELGIEIEVGPVLHVREFISTLNPASHMGPGFHQLEILFSARRVGDALPHMPASADRLQTGVRWLPLASLAGQRLHPLQLRDLLARGEAGPVYLGAAR